MLWTLNFSQGGSTHQFFLVMPNLRAKNFLDFFHLQSALDSEFFRWSIQEPTFFGHSKFEVKKFSEFFPLLSTLDRIFQRVVWVYFFWWWQIWNQKIFRIFSFTECSGLWIFCRGVRAPTFFGHPKFEVNKFLEFFPLLRALHWIFHRGVWNQLFLVIINLRPKNFQNFFLYRALWTLNLLGRGSRH